ncbi:MAG: molybdopterin-dependent oxidoreductase [Gammaproteobacteria bacterium]|nr:molybdopterin-dependent oxidoreductase [Gammaproteobacteria bacterium]
MNHSPPARRHSTCPHDCPSTCALEVEKLDARTIGRVYGAKGNSYTSGVICAKVANYAERVHHPARLTRPLRRIGEKGAGHEAFAPIGWDEALDEVAERLSAAAAEYGPESVWPYFYAGTMGLVQRDGIERLRHVMKYSRQHSTICITLADAGWLAGIGEKRGLDPRELSESDLIVMWGGNPVHTQVNVMHHVSRARRERGTRFVVVDPYRTATAEKSDLHLMPKPGTDGALACATMHVLFAEGFADRNYLERYTDAPGELEAHLHSRTPQWAESICGVPAAQIIEFARLYGCTKRSFIRTGYGFTRSRNGAVNMHAVTCLPAVTGAWQYPGGGALYSNNGIYRLDMSLIMGLDALDKSVRLLDQSRIGPILCGDTRDLGDGPPVKALFVQNTNPAVVAPESLKVRQGLQRQDLFTCVHEQFLTETASMADIVLPATTFLEHDDLYTAGGHTHLQLARQVIEPVGESRSNHQVICALAKRLGAQHPGFEMSEWQLIDATLKQSGRSDAAELAAQHWLDCALPFERAHFLNGFATPDGKFHFKPDWSRVGHDVHGLPALPDHYAVTDNATSERPFRLVTAPARQFLNTSFTEAPTSRTRETRPVAKIHPSDCAELGVQSGDLVSIGNQRTTIRVHVEAFDGLQPKTLIIESIWPNGDFLDGVGVNALVSAEPGAPLGGAVFHDTSVWVERALTDSRSTP